MNFWDQKHSTHHIPFTLGAVIEIKAARWGIVFKGFTWGTCQQIFPVLQARSGEDASDKVPGLKKIRKEKSAVLHDSAGISRNPRNGIACLPIDQKNLQTASAKRCSLLPRIRFHVGLFGEGVLVPQSARPTPSGTEAQERKPILLSDPTLQGLIDSFFLTRSLAMDPTRLLARDPP